MADNYLARQQGEWLVISLTPDVCKRLWVHQHRQFHTLLLQN